ncbi:hypothetical protein [Bacillus safensis]|uniref:hypothetical protein n=1 Tax=Bacillus safensis TaxID=561879 RepID=UPI002E234E37|nr:hypothetical protein [Bacillus safensis]
MSLLIQFFQGGLLLAIIILAYKAILLLMDARVSKKFVLKSFISKDEDKTTTIEDANTTVLERLLSIKKYKRHLENELQKAGMNISAERFIFKRILLTVIITALILSLFVITGVKLYLYLSIPIAFLIYRIPKKQIDKNKKYISNQMKIEMPEYLSSFAVLLQSYTPYEATKKSIDYSGDMLRPYVADLITHIELYPSSPKPYMDFAEKVNIREAREFVSALNQLMNVDRSNANQIISDQIKIMDELQEEGFNEQLEDRPEQVEKFISPMLFPLVGIIFTFLFILISNAFSQLN